jgi:hypothetical protein
MAMSNWQEFRNILRYVSEQYTYPIIRPAFLPREYYPSPMVDVQRHMLRGGVAIKQQSKKERIPGQ